MNNGLPLLRHIRKTGRVTGSGQGRIKFQEGIVITLLVSLAYAVLLWFAPGAWADERLVYAVAYKGSHYAAIRTEIFSIDPETAEKRFVFSDEKTAIVLIQRLYVFHFPVVGGGKLFAHAAERGRSVPFPGNGSLYELAIDGSNLVRLICPVLGAESLGELFVNSTGTRIGYLNRINGTHYLFIHDVVSGRLLSQIDLTDKFLDCYASSIGWLPRSQRLFFSLETGDVHVTSEASYARVGTFFINESGRDLKRLPALPGLKGFFPPEATRLIGVRPTGEYVFETRQRQKRPSPGRNPSRFLLLKVKKDFSDMEDISFSPGSEMTSGIRIRYQLSPSGKHLSAARLPISSSAVSGDIWLKNLDTGREHNLLSLPTEGLQGPFLGLVGWLDPFLESG